MKLPRQVCLAATLIGACFTNFSVCQSVVTTYADLNGDLALDTVHYSHATGSFGAYTTEIALVDGRSGHTFKIHSEYDGCRMLSFVDANTMLMSAQGRAFLEHAYGLAPELRPDSVASAVHQWLDDIVQLPIAPGSIFDLVYRFTTKDVQLDRLGFQSSTIFLPGAEYQERRSSYLSSSELASADTATGGWVICNVPNRFSVPWDRSTETERDTAIGHMGLVIMIAGGDARIIFVNDFATTRRCTPLRYDKTRSVKCWNDLILVQCRHDEGWDLFLIDMQRALCARVDARELRALSETLPADGIQFVCKRSSLIIVDRDGSKPMRLKYATIARAFAGY